MVSTRAWLSMRRGFGNHKLRCRGDIVGRSTTETINCADVRYDLAGAARSGAAL